MSEEKPDFLRRWSRLKREAAATAATPPARAAAEKPPELPSIDSLNFDSDFSAFMKAKVDQSLKRAALKKLFADPRFNYMDGLDVWTGDYTGEDPIPESMLAQLDHAKQTLFGSKQEPPKEAEVESETKAQESQESQESKDDGDQRQDA